MYFVITSENPGIPALLQENFSFGVDNNNQLCELRALASLR
jgi:hypothetical protein